MLAEKMLQFKLPPRTPSAFQQARRRALHRSVFLERAALFGYEDNDGLEDSARASCPSWEGRDGREDPTSQLHTCVEKKVIKEIRDILEWGGGIWVGTTRLGVVSLAAAVLTPATAFFLFFAEAR